MPDQKESENTKLTCEEQKDNELVSRVIENPEVLNRVLDSPQVRAIVCQHFQGPVPPPSMLKKYDQLVPGLANRLVELTEKEQAHRHKTVADSIDIARDGQTKAFWLAILIILAATVFGVMGETVLAGTLVSIDLVALVTAFIVGKHYSKQELDQD
ncbi:DUF2335 domain-containing protein [Escherichia coli]|uniref:DUF2335 domain-containing protein n=1 Tax=Escherichia coli TaxID=562 RepID=UPI00044C5FA6|nr:DUF2335 domain-containing protein [Escherichia coli]EFH7909176.1 DUF2335 domain-containing protein [Escherichia coli O157:H7]EAC2128464.1 DUF2335 domain-containing protein [Escherichia coli]EEU5329949.1 DUF2335 domain-containing protein [Escherichia coli]EEW1246971.1 DUF2335 domain-containing protein [Escherichia coli]EEW6024300.1 DUF2335 domain-containing protein [Escherichia coli]